MDGLSKKDPFPWEPLLVFLSGLLLVPCIIGLILMLKYIEELDRIGRFQALGICIGCAAIVFLFRFRLWRLLTKK